jgi:hypothetical protein
MVGLELQIKALTVAAVMVQLLVVLAVEAAVQGASRRNAHIPVQVETVVTVLRQHHRFIVTAVQAWSSLKSPDTVTATFSGGVTSKLSTAGGFNIYTVTATSTTGETVTFF